MGEYRTDIDGLRAIAVLGVVLYHLGVQRLGGGFVGVDIFFVISGFLITQLLLGSPESHPSVSSFYERRVRRIVPALSALLCVATVTAVLILPTVELREYSQNLIAAVLFASNVYDEAKRGYFDIDATWMPLLHLWSLAIEEQFYIVYPLALGLVLRFAPQHAFAFLAGGFIASLGVCVWLSLSSPQAAFYFAPGRAWELLLGAMSVLSDGTILRRRAVREAASIAGLLLVVAPMVLFRATPAFPVVCVVIPCVGATLLIASGRNETTAVGRLLGSRPLVSIGLISYSLYLWHWPIIVFYNRLVLRPLTNVEIGAVAVASFAVAAMSWRFIERPFRGATSAAPRKVVFAAAAWSAAIFLASGAVGILTDGLPQRLSPERQRIAAYGDYFRTPEFQASFRSDECWDGNIATVLQRCLVWKSDRPNIALWGDSWAARLYPGLAYEAGHGGENLVEAARSSCWPVLDSPIAGCAAFNLAVLQDLLTHADVVVLAARYYAQPDDVGKLAATARMLAQRGIAVFVVSAWPAYRYPAPWLIDRYLATGDARFVGDTRSISPDGLAMDARLSHALAGIPNVHLVTARSACPDAHCPISIGHGVPIAWDRGHLTLAGSRYVAHRIWPRIAQLPSKGTAAPVRAR